MLGYLGKDLPADELDQLQHGFLPIALMPERATNPKQTGLGGMADRLRAAYDVITGKQVRNPFGVGVGIAPNYTDAIYKAVIPNFLYKPPFGYPLFKDIPEIRRMAGTTYVTMVTNTVGNEISSLDWNVLAREGANVPESVIDQTKDFFYNPNRNEESMGHILKAWVRDILEVDAGLVVKVRNLKDEFMEMYVRDGGTFTKNPDIFGVMPEFNAYFQYGWLTGARPIPFNRNEIVYTMMNPRSDSIYGRSPVEVLLNVLQLLTYGIDSNLDYFRDNNIPKGVMQMIGAEKSDIEGFQGAWQEQLKKKDAAGNWRRYWHKMPVVNTEGNFVRIGFSNLELELIEQQKWFTKLVWACFNVTESELGIVESSSRAAEVVQSSVVMKRKLIKPLVQTLEYHINTEIINDLPWIKGKYEDQVLFDFDKYDLATDLNERKLHWGDLKMGLRTPNEVREALNLEPIAGGEQLRQIGGGGMFGFQTTGGFEKEEALKARKVGGFESPEPGDIPEKGKKILARVYAECRKKNPKWPKARCSKVAWGAVKRAGYKAEKKALETSSPVVLGEFEEMAKPEYLKKKLSAEIAVLQKTIKSLVKREAGSKTLEQIKAIDSSFIRKLSELISFTGLREAVNGMVRMNFLKGLEVVEKKTQMNFVPNQQAIDFLQKYTFENVAGLGEELKNDLRQELQRGLMAGEGVTKLSERVDKVLDVGKNRAAMISRTESNRAENMGSLDGYRQSGLGGEKEWVATLDANTSALCKALDGKKVPLDGKFSYRGEEFDSPPAHVNCRSTIVFHPK